MDEIAQGAPTALQATKLYARFAIAASPQEEEAILEEIKALLGNSVSSANPTLQVLAAFMLEKHGKYEEALRAAHNCRSLEGKAAMAQLYLRIDRPEQAEKELKAMTSSDDDATLTHLTAVRVHLYNGGQKRVQEALAIVEDLVERYGATSLLHNLAGACLMHLGKWEDAETSLKEALQKDPNSGGALVNMANVCLRLNKHPLAARYVAQLKTLPKGHSWLDNVTQAEANFDATFGQ